MAEVQWWLDAVALERDDRLDEAIERLRTGMGESQPYWECQVSYLFERRAARLWDEGREAEARRAAESAVTWAWRYASGATSGAEGAALSDQAQQVEERMAGYRA